MIPSIFKAYDIRGLSPQELDADAAHRIGQALVKFTGSHAVVVGKDCRATTPMIFDALADGIMSQGADVIDIGKVTTPMLYFAVGEYELHDAGAMITASHNPKEYNGIKLCYGDVLPIGAESGMAQIRDLALAGHFPQQPTGTAVETDITDDYLRRLFAEADFKKLRRLKVVADCGNGMEGVIIEKIFKRLPWCDFYGMFLEPDGNFPNHEANPQKEETLAALKAKVISMGADVGFAFDGDGDRVGVVDEQGRHVRGDLLSALIARMMLKKNPGSAILYPVRESMVLSEEIERAGGIPIMCRVGHGLIKPQMRRDNALFVGELANHFYYRDFYGAESSDLTMLLVLELLAETGKPLSELVAPLKRYHHSGEINLTVSDKYAVLNKLEAAYAGSASSVSKIDGLRMEFFDHSEPGEDWWFSARPSNTEPFLRLNLEAKKQKKMLEKKNELLAMISALPI